LGKAADVAVLCCICRAGRCRPIDQESLFGFLIRNSATASDYFLIPAPRVVELGTWIELWPARQFRSWPLRTVAVKPLLIAVTHDR